jgi:hypothetical protein
VSARSKSPPTASTRKADRDRLILVEKTGSLAL